MYVRGRRIIHEKLMIGNEAIVRAYEAGATVATAYPGTLVQK